MDTEEEAPGEDSWSKSELPEYLKERKKTPVAKELEGKTTDIGKILERQRTKTSRHAAPPEMTPKEKKAWKRAGEELWEKREGKRTTLEETASQKKEGPKEFGAVKFGGKMYTPEAAREKLEDLQRLVRIFRTKPDETVIGKGRNQRTLRDIRDSYRELRDRLGLGIEIEPKEESPES